MSYFNKDWKQFKFSRYGCKFFVANITKPPQLETLVNMAEKLSSQFDYIRVDLYLIDNKIYFGEYTCTPVGCNRNISDDSFEQLLLKFLQKGNVDYTEINKFLY